jgi:hypothetical protein
MYKECALFCKLNRDFLGLRVWVKGLGLGVLNMNIGLQVFCDMFLIKDGIPKAIHFFSTNG